MFIIYLPKQKQQTKKLVNDGFRLNASNSSYRAHPQTDFYAGARGVTSLIDTGLIQLITVTRARFARLFYDHLKAVIRQEPVV